MTIEATERSATHGQLVARAKSIVPGGNFTSMRWPTGVDDIVFDRGAGPRIYDVDGRSYLDFMLGAGPTILGHGHVAVTSAIQEQAGRIVHTYMLNPIALELSEELLATAPWGDMVRLTNSGSEATFYALRLARAFTGREQILKFEGGYHGHQDYAMLGHRPAAQTAYPIGAPDSAGIPNAVQGSVLVAPWNDLETTTSIIRAHASSLAAVITEPTPKGVEPVPGFLEMLREETTKAGALLVLDEIVSGFRFRYGGQAADYGIDPDLATYSKIVAGGLPLGAVIGRGDVMELADPSVKGKRPYVFFSGTNYGNPICCAAGLATLRELKRPGTYEALAFKGERIRSGLGSIFAERDVDVAIFGQGPTFEVLFTSEAITDYWSMERASAADRRVFYVSCLRRGLLLNGPARSFISTVHSDADLDEALAIFAAAADDVVAARGA